MHARSVAASVAATWGIAVVVTALWPEPVPRRAPLPAAPAVSAPRAIPDRAPGPVVHARRITASSVVPAGVPADAYERSTDLAALVLDLSRAAAEGDGRSQYVLYRALGECRDFLGTDARRIDANYAYLLNFGALAPAERADWHATYERCRGFAALDWSVLAPLLGPEDPVDAGEFAAVWLERAVQSGYPEALAEQARRPDWDALWTDPGA